MAERAKTTIIAIHCSDTKPSMEHVNENLIREWHKAKGWTDAGYNIVIPRTPSSDMTGLIEIARPLDHRGAHIAGVNSTALGICVVGGMSEDGEPEDNFLPEQMFALKMAIGFCLMYAPKAKCAGHNYFTDKKTCPNFDWRKWCDEQGFERL